MFRVNKKPQQVGVESLSKKFKRRLLLKELALGAGVLVAFVVLIQLFYPAGRSLPFASFGTKQLGYKTTAEIGAVVQGAFEDSSAHITAERLSVDAKLSSIGADVDVDRTASQVLEYPWWQRLIPFSILWSHPKIEKLYLTFEEEQLNNAVSSVAKKLTAPPKNGTVSISSSGEIVLVAAENGISVIENDVREAIKTTVYSVGTSTVAVDPTIVKPTVTNETLEKVKTDITTALGRTVVITDSISKATYTPSKKDIALWVNIGDDLTLSLNKDAVVAYANLAAKAQIIAAGTTKVATVDGIEKSRTTGATGRGVSADGLVSDLTKALFSNGSTSVTLSFAAVAPAVTYDRSYTNSQAALQAYVNEVTSDGSIEIAVTQLSGAGWSAASGSTKSVVSASTYKLFVSLLLFDKINAGQIHWSDAIQGTNVETCLNNTIIYSANNCAEQWIGEWGRSWMNNALYGKGISSATTFTAADATHTSAQDLRTLLLGLHNQSLFNSADASRLIGLMKQQVYRKGIPSGSQGTVANKVGFLWDYLNDAAIVYHPRGTYVLVVMTKGQSWGKIAEITRQLEKIMYP